MLHQFFCEGLFRLSKLYFFLCWPSTLWWDKKKSAAGGWEDTVGNSRRRIGKLTTACREGVVNLLHYICQVRAAVMGVQQLIWTHMHAKHREVDFQLPHALTQYCTTARNSLHLQKSEYFFSVVSNGLISSYLNKLQYIKPFSAWVSHLSFQ